LSQAAPVLMAMHMRLAEFCRQAYGISAPTTA
jgi:hypothetical protein